MLSESIDAESDADAMRETHEPAPEDDHAGPRRNPGPVYVTRPSLPPLAELMPLLEEIWESRILTNGGPFHERLEAALCDHLDVAHASLVANCTLGLILALNVLGDGGEVITTPYSYVATAQSLRWNGMTPAFVDIEPNTFNLDPDRIEAAITPRTTAILPVHCYGVPCDVQAIRTIADRHRLPVIYDAAQAFGVRCGGDSVLRHGDASTVSFHATKVFNTFEGGIIVCRDADTKARVDRARNFGMAGASGVVSAGLNAKLSEFNAALGLLQLKHVGAGIVRRGEIDGLYRQRLEGCRGIRCPAPPPGVMTNHSYFPILCDPGRARERDAIHERLARNDIHSRRYFHPLISELPMYRNLPSAGRENLPVAHRIADTVLCLPIYPDLTDAMVHRIADLVVSA